MEFPCIQGQEIEFKKMKTKINLHVSMQWKDVSMYCRQYEICSTHIMCIMRVCLLFFCLCAHLFVWQIFERTSNPCGVQRPIDLTPPLTHTLLYSSLKGEHCPHCSTSLPMSVCISHFLYNRLEKGDMKGGGKKQMERYHSFW